ncbi:polyketide synthase [Krasilnikovia sp. MM14-A1259]|uniref:polyketide synthase n=1 Tax=Krasilnikovia sp. MM14-A1259 TaxID=3373539 RepID=UPI0038247324
MALIDIRDDRGVRVVHLVDSAGGNALDHAMVEALRDACAIDDEVRVIVLRGLTGVFSRGASDDVLRDLVGGVTKPSELNLPRALLGVEVPLIAAMEGHAIGGGLILGLCADIVLIARESRYGTTFVNHGFTPGMGATRLLERVMSPVMAHEMLLTGEPRRGVDLVAHGFNYVLPRSEAWPRAREIALRLADQPRTPLTLLKRELSRPWLAAFDDAHRVETEMHAVCFAPSPGAPRAQ